MSVNNNLLDKIFVHSFTKKKNVRVAILAYLLFNNKKKSLKNKKIRWGEFDRTTYSFLTSTKTERRRAPSSGMTFHCLWTSSDTLSNLVS